MLLTATGDAYFKELYQTVGESWRITHKDSLFDYVKGESTATFTDRSIPTSRATLDSLDPAARTAAETTCRALGVPAGPSLDDCTLDVAITGDAGYAASAISSVGATADVVEPVSPPVAIAIGDTRDGSLAQLTESSRFTFTAKAGQIVYLDASGPCVDGLLWNLLDPAGATLWADTLSCTDVGPTTLPTAGTYTIRLYSVRATTGAYAFRLSLTP